MLATITWRPLHPADLLGMAVERSHVMVSHSDVVKVNGSGSVAAGQDVSVPVKRCHPGAVCKSGHSLNSILQWFGQMTPWCKRELREMAFKVLGGDLAKRLLGVGVIWPKDSMVPGLNQHQGVFLPYHPNTKESFCQTKNSKNSNFKSAFWA